MKSYLGLAAIWALITGVLVAVTDLRVGPAEALPKPRQEFETIELGFALSLFQQSGNLFVDARGREDYLGGHIKGAEPALWLEKSPGRPDFNRALDRAPNLVVYGTDAAACYRVIGLLVRRGFQNVKWYRPGWAEWSALNLPAEHGGN